MSHFTLSAALSAFLLAFSALFSVVNPPGGAFIFHEVTSALGQAQRVRLADRVGLYSFIVILTALWGGAYVLNFFGISLAALRVAGGAFVALRAWDLLATPERQEERKTEQAGRPAPDMDGLAFFPLTMPFTTGPGTIATAVALGAGRPAIGSGLAAFFVGMSAAAAAIAVCVWLAYRFADVLAARVGQGARRTISRMSAFLLLCIGVQILMTGLEDAVRQFLAVTP